MQRHSQKILIIGAGSIGQRHLRNLLSLGYRDIFVAEIDKDKRDEIKSKYKIKIFSDYKNALKESWDAVFICAPPAFNIKIAGDILNVQKNKCAIFIEKPLSNNLAGVPELIKKARQYKTPIMIGYNLRFHPLIKKTKDILDKKLLGKIYGARSDMSQYLPDWHPREDYRRGYSANKKLGGGIVLDDIHDIDYLCWFFGDVNKVSGFVAKVSNLEINTEDYADLTLYFKIGAIAQMHMDYLQRRPSRSFKIIGEKGTLICDIINNELKYFLANGKKWRSYKLKNFDYNKTYIDEIKYFMDCAKKNKNPESDIVNGYKTLKIALDAKRKTPKI